MRIIAGIVLYNPDIERLGKNIKAIRDQVDRVYLVDNGSKKHIIEKVLKYCDEKIILIKNNKNFGVAKALNQIVQMGYRDGAAWALLLDQDSIAADDLIEQYKKYEQGRDLAIICPRIVDLNKEEKSNKEGAEEIDRCITSGSLVNIEVCLELDGFLEEMFIDFVDFEYCKRVRLVGKKILKVNTAKLCHEVGKRTKKRLLFFTVYPTNHNAKRVYYYARNVVYYKRKFRGKLSFREWLYAEASLVWKWVSVVLYEDNKRAKLKSYFSGKKDAKKMSYNVDGLERESL